MKLNVRYKRPFEEAVTTQLELHKNQKGYNINIEGKYYFPKADNPVVKDLEKYQDQQDIWVVVVKDNYNYGNIAFAKPDFFVKVDENKVIVEKEVPLNNLDDPEHPYTWDYLNIGEVDNADDTDRFIDDLENNGCPEVIIKEALKEFYALN